MRRLILLAALLAGCGVDLQVAVDGPEDFLLIVARADGEVQQLACPGGEQDSLRCVPGGAEVDAVRGEARLTVKSRGWSFVSQLVDGQPGEAPHLAPERLAESQATPDYATGFGVDGLEDFVALAWPADTALGPAQSVKFYIADLQGEPTVYFQNTQQHPLHYEFARDVLGLSTTPSGFFVDTYQGEDRQAMAGTLVRYPAVAGWSEALGEPVEAPIAVTFFPSDDLSPALALRAHQLIEEHLGFAPLRGGAGRVVYLPAGDQSEAQLIADRAEFDARAALWARRAELSAGEGLQILNPGLAYGTLRLVEPDTLQQQVWSYTDVLVLRRLPNELPIVGGTITEEQQTPLAHVNVAAMARGTPNIAWPDASTEVQDLVGELVRFEVTADDFSLEPTTLAEAQAYWDSHVPEPVAPPADLSVEGLPGFDELGFDDSLAVGAKAANLAELHGLLPEVSPAGFAVPFVYYQRFMESAQLPAGACAAAQQDCGEEGRGEALCAEARAHCDAGPADERLDAYRRRISAEDAFRTDTALREALLDGLRHHIRGAEVPPDFAAALDARVLEVFGDAKARLRSSTNAEDLDDFPGAGLYTSVSAYGSGPDKLASEQIRKVWASVWSWRAYEERSFWGIDHDAVYMGVAVSRAYPDEDANGVLLTQNIADPTVAGVYVNVQLGEVPVTNPVGGAIPEVFSIVPGPSGLQVARWSWSSLSPEVPILRDAEVAALHDAAGTIQEHFSALYEQSPYELCLDLEFKFVPPQRSLVIKQVRPFVQ